MEFKVLDGMNTYYYSNGMRAANGKGINGIKVGVWIYFDTRGKMSCSRMETPAHYISFTDLDYTLVNNPKYSSKEVMEILSSDTEE